jgi:hypothetical protein
MDAMIAAITTQLSKQMAAQAAACEEHFRSLKGYGVVTSELEVTTKRAL